ncbi:hypothetical protein [Allorhizocola rhizosphaerae]|uniref:hypothetical protein n=1 Tax=Allorhizocola rhizosphaerae TaxID=1872709 RepID=UPI001FE3FAC3|nr:hypothetical protein [Allorhizocola rhizosphaerae]
MLLLTALATAAVEALNWVFTDDAGFALFVRTGWALLRSLGFLVLIWHVRRQRPGAWPFALVLTVTTLFALARLVIPREGRPHAAGIAGFVVVAVLCGVVLWMVWRPGVITRPVTVRIAALSYSPIMLVASMVALEPVFGGRVEALPAVIVWFVAAIVVSYAVLLVAFFHRRGRLWAQTAYTIITLPVIAIHVPFTWWLLGTDGLLRDAAPLLLAAVVVLTGPRAPRSPAAPAASRPRPT